MRHKLTHDSIFVQGELDKYSVNYIIDQLLSFIHAACQQAELFARYHPYIVLIIRKRRYNYYRTMLNVWNSCRLHNTKQSMRVSTLYFARLGITCIPCANSVQILQSIFISPLPHTINGRLLNLDRNTENTWRSKVHRALLPASAKVRRITGYMLRYWRACIFQRVVGDQIDNVCFPIIEQSCTKDNDMMFLLPYK